MNFDHRRTPTKPPPCHKFPTELAFQSVDAWQHGEESIGDQFLGCGGGGGAATCGGPFSHLPTCLDRRAFFATTFAGAAAFAWSMRPAAAVEFTQFPTVETIRAAGPEFWNLVDRINAYREANDLPAIPLSPRLSAVAYLHVRDLADNQPHLRHGSLHSWSDDPRWTGGAYRPGDKSTLPIMWNKPRELTGYDAIGFEICVKDARDIQRAFDAWIASPAHRSVILNQGTWADRRWQWRAVGAVFHKGYACAWFGNAADSAD